MYPGAGVGLPPQGPKRRKVWPWVAIGCVVLLAAAGIPLALLWGGSGEQGTEEQAGPTLSGEIAWQQQVQDSSPVFGSWIGGGVVARVGEDGVQAFSQDNGSEAWSLTPQDGGGEVFCGASPTAENGVALIAVGKSASWSTNCNVLMLVDLKTGQPRWQHTMPKAPPLLSDPESMMVSVTGDQAVAEHAGRVFAYGLDPNGKKLWDYTKAPDECRSGDLLAEGDQTAFVLTCDDSSKLVLLNNRGEVTGESTVGEFEYSPTVVSADPVVLSVDTGGMLESVKEFRTFDDQGRKLATIPENQGKTKLDASAVNSQGPSRAHQKPAALMKDGLFVIPTVPTPSPDSNVRETNKLVAFDIKTGQKRWEQSMGSDITATPISAVDGGFLAINDGTFEKPPKVVRFATQDGSISPVSPPYQAATEEDVTAVSSTELTWSDGAVYGVSMSTSTIAPAAFALR